MQLLHGEKKAVSPDKKVCACDDSTMRLLAGLPTLQEQASSEVSHQPWPGEPLVLPLEPAAEQGEDCLQLSWSIDADAQLQLEISDLRSGQAWSHPCLGAVR